MVGVTLHSHLAGGLGRSVTPFLPCPLNTFLQHTLGSVHFVRERGDERSKTPTTDSDSDSDSAKVDAAKRYCTCAFSLRC